MNKFYVYALIDPRTSQPFYIGKGCGGRAQSHLNLRTTPRKGDRKRHKIQRIREDGFEPTISYLFVDLEESEAFNQEELEIRRYGRKDLDPGGILMNYSLDSRPPNRTGRLHSDITKAKMSAAAKGKKKSPEHCRAIGDAKRGKIQGPRSDTAKSNMSAWQQRTYQIISPDDKTYIIKSAKMNEFCQNFKLKYGGLMAAIKYDRSYKGWTIKRI